MENKIVQIKSHLLYPSNLIVSKEELEINTLLGSCIAICLYDQRFKIGGMNHYMLPLWNGDGLASPKYGNIAFEMLLEKMLQAGAQKKNMVAKLFGGASQFEQIFNVGERNIQLAESLLTKQSISITAQSTGGELGRRIIFNTQSGQVLMKWINKVEW